MHIIIIKVTVTVIIGYYRCSILASEVFCYMTASYEVYAPPDGLFTVDLDDRQWLQCMCTQIPRINKVGMDAGVVVVNGGASCDVNGRIMSTLSTYLWLHYS